MGEAGTKGRATREAIARSARAYETGHPDEATTILEEAYKESGDPALLFELGELHGKVGRLVEAKRVFERYLLRAPNGPFRATAERRLREIELGRPLGSASAPATGKVNAPVPAPVPGPVAGDDITSVRVSPPPVANASSLPSEAAPPLAPQPVATQPSAPSAPAPQPVAPPPLTSPSPAARAIPAAAPPQQAGSSTSTALIARSADNAHDGRDLPLPRWVPWSGAAVTLGLVTGAIFTGLAAGRRYDGLKNGCGAKPEGCPSSDIDDLRSKARTANILWGAAALMGAATGVAFYVDARAGGVSALWTF